jgi:hypothetical protein
VVGDRDDADGGTTAEIWVWFTIVPLSPGSPSAALGLSIVLPPIGRTFLFQPFNIPSGVAEATLLVGDYMFV